MGERTQFNPGDKAPNDGIYIEIDETKSMIKNPKAIHLKAGEHFPETSNHNRKWTFKPKP